MAGAQPLLDYIKGFECNSNIAIAAAEGKRLGPYFNALGGYLSQAIELDTTPRAPEETAALKDAAQPERLRTLFNTVAEKTRNTLVSDVVIAPLTVLQNGPAAHFFKDQDQFAIGYETGGHPFKFGFLQVFENKRPTEGKGSVSFPVFLLDEAMMDAVAPHAPEALLRGLQKTLAFVNHDMLHHLTAPVIKGSVAAKISPDPAANALYFPEHPLRLWLEQLPKFGDNELYEEWAQISHEGAMLSPANLAQVASLDRDVAQFFKDLKTIGQDIAAEKGVPAAHEVVDYYGMVMAHALTRVFPLHHPVIARCLDGLQAADPQPATPENAAADAVGGMRERPDLALKNLMQLVTINGGLMRLVDNYRKEGLHILPAEEDKNPDWKGVKLLQIARMAMDDVHPHMPEPLNNSMKEMRAQAGPQTVRMFGATVKAFTGTW